MYIFYFAVQMSVCNQTPLANSLMASGPTKPIHFVRCSKMVCMIHRNGTNDELQTNLLV